MGYGRCQSSKVRADTLLEADTNPFDSCVPYEKAMDVQFQTQRRPVKNTMVVAVKMTGLHRRTWLLSSTRPLGALYVRF